LGGHLIIRRRIDNQVEEYFPVESIAKDLPTNLTNGHHYWYVEGSNSIEIRPRDQVWHSGDPRYWIINLDSSHRGIAGGVSRGALDHGTNIRQLVDPHSEFYKSLSRNLKSLEPSPLGLFVTAGQGEQFTSIHVPRHNLGFRLNEKSQLECNSVPGYILSEDYSGIGCLFGLRSFICLRPADEKDGARKILVPKGQVVTSRGTYGHPEVTIRLTDHRGYFLYDVDHVVGRLSGTHSMESDLYLIILHAYTSGVLPDPLTGRSGTAEALEHLNGASPISVLNISEESRSYLDILATLTPTRTFYPQHLKVMETVAWNACLPVTSQHPQFRLSVEEILRHWRETVVFHGQKQLVEGLKGSSEPHLESRAAYRAWHYSPPMQDATSTGKESFDGLSSEYQATEGLAFRAAGLTTGAVSGMPICRSLLSIVKRWGQVHGIQELTWEDVQHWIQPPKSLSINEIWCTLFELARDSTWPPPFETTVAIGFLGYCQIPMDLLATLVAVMREHSFHSVIYACPQFSMIDLNAGSDFKESEIRDVLRRAKVSFQHSDEYHLEKRPNETNQSRSIRAEAAYDAAVEEQVAQSTTELRPYWPEVPHIISLSTRRLLQPSQSFLASEIRPLLHQWSQNRSFLRYIETVGSLLGTFDVVSSPVTNVTYAPRVPSIGNRRRSPLQPSLGTLLQNCGQAPVISSTSSLDIHFANMNNDSTRNSDHAPDVERLLDYLETPGNHQFESEYLLNLRQSLQAFISSQSPANTASDTLHQQLCLARDSNRQYLQETLASISSALKPSGNMSRMLSASGLWPPITAYVLLRQLSILQRSSLLDPWLEILVNYAINVHDAKRIDRMLRHFYAGPNAGPQLINELQYHRDWKPMEYPDWLLVEIDGDFSIRPAQAELAIEMMHPDGGENAVMQLNMGEGKSSVSYYLGIYTSILCNSGDCTDLSYYDKGDRGGFSSHRAPSTNEAAVPDPTTDAHGSLQPPYRLLAFQPSSTY
jgi:hypothetical protein